MFVWVVFFFTSDVKLWKWWLLSVGFCCLLSRFSFFGGCCVLVCSLVVLGGWFCCLFGSVGWICVSGVYVCCVGFFGLVVFFVFLFEGCFMVV